MYRIIILSIFLILTGCKSTQPKSQLKQVMEAHQQYKKNIKNNTKPKPSGCVYSDNSDYSFDNVVDANDVSKDFNSQPIKTIPPKYPLVASKNNTEGFVKASFITDEKGCVINIKIIESAPLGVFDTSMINALKRWRYLPNSVDGKTIKVRREIQIDFIAPKEKLKTTDSETNISLDLENIAAEKLKGF
jgi:TonB family protein